uniref:Deoxyuridine 5'-triphosphate nucleotidohydrolase n=1 Tax=Strix occidentalis caurina TaxID=311401 RepID=A0A8D0KW60_STROC
VPCVPIGEMETPLMHMTTPNLQIKPLTVNETLTYWEIVPGALAPYRATPEAAGLDLYALKLTKVTPKQIRVIDTGVGIQIPTGHFGLITARSSLALKGVQVMGGVIDADYQGEIKIKVMLQTSGFHVLSPGTKIAQLLILPYWVPQAVSAQRGTAGFGSTGAKDNN